MNLKFCFFQDLLAKILQVQQLDASITKKLVKKMKEDPNYFFH